MNIQCKQITVVGVAALLASLEAGCRPQFLRQFDECSPVATTSAPIVTSAGSVAQVQQYTAAFARPIATADDFAREISGMRGDINRLRREVGKVQEDVSDIKSKLPAQITR
jgi:hypothetical protein